MTTPASSSGDGDHRMRELQLGHLDGAADRPVTDRDITQRISNRFEKRRLVCWGQRLSRVGDVKKLALGKRYAVHRLLLEERRGRSSMQLRSEAA